MSKALFLVRGGRAPIATRYGLRFVTDLAHEFVARLCGPPRKRLIAAPAVRKSLAWAAAPEKCRLC